jgi:serine/threonine-protein kinase
MFVTLAAMIPFRAALGDSPPLLLHALVVGGLGGAVCLLASPVDFKDGQLRSIEAFVFGIAALFLAVRQFQTMDHWAGLRNEAEVVSTVKTTVIGTTLLIFAYCMLIPNDWRTAALVVAALVAVPVLTELGLYALHPATLRTVRQFARGERVVADVLVMVIASGLSVWGTHVINALRSEAFEARLYNQYRLGRKLGTGGMGEVYLAEHRLLKRPCALKLIRPDTAADPVSLTRFEREVRATARLSHPNTIEVYDYGRADDGTFYYVMEYLRGLSLEEVIKRHGPMSPGRVVHLLRQVCGALAEAHAEGLIHRDVKPANVFACARGGMYDVAKLLDFGLVKGEGLTSHAGRKSLVVSREGVAHGTPLYMSPEQVVAAPLDRRCDLYSVGAVAFHLLTGAPPFPGEDRVSVMTSHVRDPVPSLRSERQEVPPDLEAVILRCLAKSPGDRFSDASELSAALGRCACAGDWDSSRAESWWHEFEPAAVAPPPG